MRRSRCEGSRDRETRRVSQRWHQPSFRFALVFSFRSFSGRARVFRASRARRAVFTSVRGVVGTRRRREARVLREARALRGRGEEGKIRDAGGDSSDETKGARAERLFFIHRASSSRRRVVASSRRCVALRRAFVSEKASLHAHDWQLDLFDLGKLPLLVAQRAVRARAQPLGDAIQVEHVPAVAPRDGQPLLRGVRGVGLVLDGRLVQGVSANRARVRADGPRPHRDGVPLFRETGRGGQRLVVGASRRAKESARDFGLGRGARKTRAAPRVNHRRRVVRTFFTSNRFFSATSVMITCEPGSRGRGATHTVGGAGEILKRDPRGVEENEPKETVFIFRFSHQARFSVTTTYVRDGRRVARTKTVAFLPFVRLYPSTPAHPRATRACWSPSRSRWRP